MAKRLFVIGMCTAVMAATVWVSRAAQQGFRERFWVRVVFGIDGRTADWDGRLRIEEGQVLQLAEWGLEAADELDAKNFSWKIRTRRIEPGDPRPEFRDLGSQAEPTRGLLIELEAGPKGSLAIETAQGTFRVEPAALTAGRPTPFLDGRAHVERLGTGQVVAQTQTEDDFPSMAFGSDGDRYVAWIAYDDAAKREHLFVRNVDEPGSQPEAVAGAGEFADVCLLGSPAWADEGVVLRAVWCAPDEHGNWDLRTATRSKTPASWSVPVRLTGAPAPVGLTDASGSDFQLVADVGPRGEVWLAWQSLRAGLQGPAGCSSNSDILAKRLQGGRWSNDIPVATSPANEWEPSLDVDGQGRAWVGYDTYEHGSYDVYLAAIDGTQTPAVGERFPIARSDQFEAHASVQADQAGRVWVAYDVAGPNWGKDFRGAEGPNPGSYAEPIHAVRWLGLRCLEAGRLYEPAIPLPQHPGPRRVTSINRRRYGAAPRFYELPQLARDGNGRLWLMFRMSRQGYVDAPKKGAYWEIFAATHVAGGWLEPILLPDSQGRQNQLAGWAAGPGPRLAAAWSEGSHFTDRKFTVHWGELPLLADAPAEIPLRAVAVEPPGSPEPVPGVPWTLQRGNEEYHPYFGDLHRHTSISWCGPTIDGSLFDAHRYALDAARLDFLAVTDHTRDTDPYPWWRTQKTADLFHAPGHYVPIYGYERSNETVGGGHRNVFFQERGAPVNRSDHYYRYQPPPRPNRDPDLTLYPFLRERGDAITIPHTPVFDAQRNRGTWTFNDPQVEPVVEIFQGMRRSYERPDAGVALQASVWYALASGYRLGFIASSDHFSTHKSYACVWARAKTREGIFEGLRARRTFAATDRIVLDMQIASAWMGEEVRIPPASPVTLTLRAQGTTPIDEIEIIRSGAVIQTLRPQTERVETTYTDPAPLPGRSYYYVRLHQTSDDLAWGSPIWVER